MCFKEKGYIFTGKQDENKQKNLRKTYNKGRKTKKNNNSKSGAPLKKYKYYDEMQILRRRG